MCLWKFGDYRMLDAVVSICEFFFLERQPQLLVGWFLQMWVCRNQFQWIIIRVSILWRYCSQCNPQIPADYHHFSIFPADYSCFFHIFSWRVKKTRGFPWLYQDSGPGCGQCQQCGRDGWDGGEPHQDRTSVRIWKDFWQWSQPWLIGWLVKI